MASAQTSRRVQLLGLYRELLRQGRAFPSIKRDAILADIKAQWRASAALSEPSKVAECVKQAEDGLNIMLKYTNLDPMNSNWSIEMAKEVSPEEGKRQRREAEDWRRKQAPDVRSLS